MAFSEAHRHFKFCKIVSAVVLEFYSKFQSGFQSEPETAPLAAVSARYCQSVSHFTANSDTQINNLRKVFY